MKYRVLWIEDGALADLAELVGPVYQDGDFDLVVALSASEGMDAVLDGQFDVLIVDIRLPPGDGDEWVLLFRQAGLRKADAQLGLELLHALLRSPQAKVKIDNTPAWLDPNRVAIFSVENFHEVEEQVRLLGVKVFVEKEAQISHRVLLDLIKEVLLLRGEGVRLD